MSLCLSLSIRLSISGPDTAWRRDAQTVLSNWAGELQTEGGDGAPTKVGTWETLSPLNLIRRRRTCIAKMARVVFQFLQVKIGQSVKKKKAKRKTGSLLGAERPESDSALHDHGGVHG